MFSFIASLWGLLTLSVGLSLRNFECRQLAKVAYKRTYDIDQLVNCVVGEFLSEDPDASYLEWYIQSSLGYATIPSGERYSEICWEAPICLTIFHDKKPLVGMAVEFRDSALCIRQLQGVPGVTVPQTLQKWPAIFVRGAKKFLLETDDICSLRLYSADQRISYAYPTIELDESGMSLYRQNLRRRYDGTARQQKFKKKTPKYWEWTE